MAKKSSSSQIIVKPEEFEYVIKNGIKVYPVSKLDYWLIEVNNNGRLQLFEKKVSKNDLNEAIAKTIIYYYNKLRK